MIRPVLIGQAARLVAGGDLGLVQVADVVARHVDRRDAGPAGVDGLLGEVLLRGDAEGCRLDAHRQVLGDDRDLLTVLGEVHRDGQDAAVVVAEPHARRQHARVGVVQLDAQGAALADRNGEVESAVLDAEFVEMTKGLPGEVADLGIVAFSLELGDHHDGDHDVVLGEAEERPRIAQQHGCVEDVRAQFLRLLADLVDVLTVLLLWCSCGHNPLPTRVEHPAVTSRPWGHESRSRRPTRPGTLPDDLTLRLPNVGHVTDTLGDVTGG